MNIVMALKLRSYALDLVCVRLSELFNGELITPDLRIKNTLQKASNLLFHLSFTAGICLIQSCEV